MSYEKAMKHSIKKSKMQSNNYFGFSTLAQDERRKNPALGGAWFQEGMEEERAAFIEKWHKETERLLKINPSLKIV